MSQKMIHQIGRTQRIKILQLIKCSQGLSVRDLSERLKMSYMGVKQHCLSMEKEGYLKAWRKPKEGKVGRPEIAYLITAKANELFPQEAHQMTLDLLKEAEKLFGHAAADKLLFSYYETRLQHYQSRIKGIDFETRATSFVKIRNDEGFMSSFLPGNPPQLLEYHSPFLLVQKKYLLIARLEEELVSKLLDTPVHRTEREVAGQYQAIFAFGEVEQKAPDSAPDVTTPDELSADPIPPVPIPEPASSALQTPTVETGGADTIAPEAEHATAGSDAIPDEEALPDETPEENHDPAPQETIAAPEEIPDSSVDLKPAKPEPPKSDPAPPPPAEPKKPEEKVPVQTSLF